MGKKTLVIRDENGNKYSLEVSKKIYARAHADEQFCARVLQLVLENTNRTNKKEMRASAIDVEADFNVEPTSIQSSQSDAAVEPNPVSEHLIQHDDAAGEPNPVSDHLIQHDEGISSTAFRAHWTRIQVLKLIGSYKNFQCLLDNSTIRNEIVWRKIAEDMGHHTGVEAMNKFKYLKARYTKKKDNMSTKNTGVAPFFFEFYEEFEEIFGKDPNIVPRPIASSSRNPEDSISSNKAPNDTEDSTIKESARSTASPPADKKRKRKDDTILDFLKVREEARERQH